MERRKRVGGSTKLSLVLLFVFPALFFLWDI